MAVGIPVPFITIVAEKDLNIQIYRKLRAKLEELGYKVLTFS